ncbi:MAG: hypothetical protein EA379_04635 [Phycisphaerales bacterium]|nr:MAG: hypothetical protein EA379_04635 [Phycisphaerales bacterium]
MVGACALACAMVTGCATRFDTHRAEVRALYAAGGFAAARDAMEQPEIRRRYDDKNVALWWMDIGSLSLAMGDTQRAIQALNNAEAIMDQRRSETLAESLGVLLINDSQRPYLGEPYEEMYLNVLKMLAHLLEGNIVGGATVEARRMAVKANILRDRYLQYVAETRETSTLAGRVRPESLGGVVAVNEAGEFIESPLGLFLTAVTFMHADERENQRVAARRLLEAIRVQRGLVGQVDSAPFAGLEDIEPGDVNALVVVFSGQGPTKRRFPVGPLIIDGASIYFELPVLRVTPSAASRVRILVDGKFVAEAPLIEDMARVAEENHRRQLPLIYVRTLLRAAAKSFGVREGYRAVERSTDNEFARLGALLGGLLFVVTTERADLRAWETLPGRAFALLLDLEPGERVFTIEWASADGRVLERSAPRVVDVPPDGLATISGHWPR